MARQRRDARRLEQPKDALRHLPDDAALALLHRGHIESEAVDLDAMGRKLVLCAVVKLRGFQQRFRGDTPGVEAGSAKGGAAVAILPLVNAGDAQLVLCRADRGGIARGPAADDDDVETVRHDWASSNLQ